jgi:hypothetical protein
VIDEEEIERRNSLGEFNVATRRPGQPRKRKGI